ncbi:hypothetical protein ACFX1T_007672 [Malus domestica]
MAAVIALDSTNFVHHFLVILLLLIFPWAAPLSFDFPTFQQSDLTNGTGLLITEADAVIANQFIRLTKDLGGEKTNGSVGRATYGEPFLLRDKATGKLADFNTSFTFRFYARNLTALFYDQGLAFFLAPNGSLVNRALGVGGSMSVPANSSVENATEPSNEYPFVAVEFDTSRNSRPTMEDPGSGHVGIDINSVKSSITKPWNSGIVEGKLNRVWISYNSSSKNISVSLTTYANDTRRQVITSLSYLVDLNEYLTDWVVVGFSASTGAAPALIDIMSWNFTSTSLVGDGSLALSNQEKKGQSLVPSAQTIKDESLVPEPSPRSNIVKSRRRKKRMGVVISSTIGGFILACILALGLYNSCKKRATGGRADIDLTIPNELGEQFSDKIFSYKELARATRNFSDGELLGVGRYGAFYKGYIEELKTYVAVKKITRRSELVPKESELVPKEPSMRQVIQVLNCEVEVPLLILPLRTPMSTSPPDISLSSSSSSITSFQENSGSSGHGDMDNTNSLDPERVVESLDPSEPVTVVLHPESNIATHRSRTPMTTSPDIPLSASSISTPRIERKKGVLKHLFKKVLGMSL